MRTEKIDASIENIQEKMALKSATTTRKMANVDKRKRRESERKNVKGEQWNGYMKGVENEI